MESTRCVEIEPEGTSFDRLEAQLAELDRLLADGRDVALIRLECTLELAQLESSAGNHDAAWDLLDEVEHELGERHDRDGTWLAIETARRRGELHDHEADRAAAADAYGAGYELASQAVTRWPRDRELAIQFVRTARALAASNTALGHHDTAIASLDKALVVCGRFVADPLLLALDAEVSVARAQAMRALGKPLAEVLPWFDRAIARHAPLAQPWVLATIWLARGGAQHPAIAARADYEQAIAIAEPLLPDRDAAVTIAKASHNIALVLLETPAEALPYETRALELMADIAEQRGSDDDRYDLLLYRLSRADLMARCDALAAAIEEGTEATRELALLLERYESTRGGHLLAAYRGHVATWTAQLAQRVPAVYRTRPAVEVTDPDVWRCTFCRRARTEVTRLISGPRVFICDQCVAAAHAALPPSAPADAPSFECRFCGEARRRFVGTPDGVICDECVDLCREIIEEAITTSHPDLRCSFCGSPRAEVGRLVLGPDATALCDRCFDHTRAFLGRHHPYDPVLGRRAGSREPRLDVCGWCETSEAIAFVHGELLVLCDACVDLTARDML